MGVDILSLKTIERAFVAEQLILTDKALQEESLTEFEPSVPGARVAPVPPFVQEAIDKIIRARDSS